MKTKVLTSLLLLLTACIFSAHAKPLWEQAKDRTLTAESLQVFLNEGGKIDEGDPVYGYTALHYLAIPTHNQSTGENERKESKKRDKKLIRLLLARKANINLRSFDFNQDQQNYLDAPITRTERIVEASNADLEKPLNTSFEGCDEDIIHEVRIGHNMPRPVRTETITLQRREDILQRPQVYFRAARTLLLDYIPDRDRDFHEIFSGNYLSSHINEAVAILVYLRQNNLVTLREISELLFHLTDFNRLRLALSYIGGRIPFDLSIFSADPSTSFISFLLQNGTNFEATNALGLTVQDTFDRYYLRVASPYTNPYSSTFEGRERELASINSLINSAVENLIGISEERHEVVNRLIEIRRLIQEHIILQEARRVGYGRATNLLRTYTNSREVLASPSGEITHTTTTTTSITNTTSASSSGQGLPTPSPSVSSSSRVFSSMKGQSQR